MIWPLSQVPWRFRPDLGETILYVFLSRRPETRLERPIIGSGALRWGDEALFGADPAPAEVAQQGINNLEPAQDVLRCFDFACCSRPSLSPEYSEAISTPRHIHEFDPTTAIPLSASSHYDRSGPSD